MLRFVDDVDNEYEKKSLHEGRLAS